MPATAQTGVLRGEVRAAASMAPLARAHVSIKGTRFGAATAVDGTYVLSGVTPGEVTVRASVLGYAPQVASAHIVAGDTTTMRFALTEAFVEIDEVVVERVSMTGGQWASLDLPSSAHFIAPADLERFGYNDIHRVLRHVPGVNLQEEDGYGLRPNIGLRGTGTERSSKISIMEDGVLIAPAPYTAPAAYFFPTVGRMHAIEIQKGASQVRFGPYTTGGAINLLSTPIPSSVQGLVRLAGGGDANRTAHAYFGKSWDRVGFLVESYQAATDGFKQLDGGGSTGFVKQDYLAKLRFQTGPNASVKQSLLLKFGVVDETSDETYLGLTDGDFVLNPIRRYAASQRDVMNAEQRQIVARHAVALSSGVDLTTTAYRTDFRRNWYKLDRVIGDEGRMVSLSDVLAEPSAFPGALGILRGELSHDGDALAVKANNRTYYAHGVQTAVGVTGESAFGSHEIELGGRLHRDEVDRFQWVDAYAMQSGVMHLTSPGIPGTDSNRIESARALSGYGQVRLRRGRIQLVPGLRFESIRQQRKDYGVTDPERTGVDLRDRRNAVRVWIPGISASVDFADGKTIFAGVHRGFAPPGTREASRPERSIDYEMGWRLFEGMARLEVVLFVNDYENLLGSDLAAAGGSSSGDQFNGGRALVYGLEAAGGYDFGLHTRRGYSIPLDFSYTYTQAQFMSTFDSAFEGWGSVRRRDELPYIPRQQLVVSTGFTGRQFMLDVSGRYTSRMRTRPGSGPTLEAESTDAHVVIDGSIRYALSRRLTISGTILNLTDASYVAARRPAGLRPGMPRRLLVGLRAAL